MGEFEGEEGVGDVAGGVGCEGLEGGGGGGGGHCGVEAGGGWDWDADCGEVSEGGSGRSKERL